MTGGINRRQSLQLGALGAVGIAVALDGQSWPDSVTVKAPRMPSPTMPGLHAVM